MLLLDTTIATDVPEREPGFETPRTPVCQAERRYDTPVVGRLLGMMDHDPLVTFPGQRGNAAVRARSVIDLESKYVGCDVLIVFEGGALERPIVVGRLRGGAPARLGTIEVGIDGERMIVEARAGLLFRCGKASITLSADGKVHIRGTEISSTATRRNRITGGTVQLN